MPIAQPSEYLVSGDVDGNFNQLFKRVANVNSKNGPFSMLLCVGNFFGQDNSQWLPYKRGEAKVPVPTFILGPSSEDSTSNYPDMKGCEMCENVIYLGPNGIYPSSSGLKMVYLSGKEAAGHGKSASTFTFDDIASLETQATAKPAIDILLTSQWPNVVCNYAKKPEGCDPQSSGSSMISRLAFKLRPRYHFCGTEGTYYERLPYRNHKVLLEPTRHVTRFIGLAKVGNPEKQKWLYAFNITPMSKCEPTELVKQPPDVTECPFSDSNIAHPPKQRSGKDTRGAQFFYDMNAKMGDERGQKRKGGGEGGERKRLPPKPTGPCWFCLASPEVEKHLVVSVGDHTYLALAKGGLVSEHLLILPITHFQSTPDLDDDCLQEIEKFKKALKAMFKKKGKRAVFFERNYRSQHLQIQVVPVSNEAALHLMETFTNTAESCSIELDEIPKLSNISQIAPPGTPYFYVELPTGEKLYHRVKKNFPLQFGREVLASPPILNVTERIDWRECKMSKEEETDLRDRIREDFQPYDFTLEDDD
ncbi:CWF19-like protein 1 isoform X3 [Portunus trituberculatus]|uniref:CWF19-like protein 1 isoform X3 n=1 Tax=Portunus trituberculatus TaxID=210409 RepID=UPI001E1CD073|nr:CWF19-like protein 1 isoform X3 [Portunus trituberculatus]